jgi:glutamate carboxypeptidase
MSEHLDYFTNQTQAMIDLTTQLVNIESFSRDKQGVDALATHIAAICESLDASSVKRITQTDVGDFILATWNEGAASKPILALCHMDTVFPAGTLAERPVRIEDGLLYGPGAVDMKGGVAVVLTALRGLSERGELPDRPIRILFTSDEEIGSRAGRPVIEQTAQDCALVLVMEPGTREGAIKTRRKGVATYRIHVEGRASHAGNAPEEGVNAIVELAQHIMRLNNLNDLRNGVSVSVTLAEGGSAGNVIPASASAFVDTRVFTLTDMNRLREAITNAHPFIPGANVRVEVVHDRPPMEYNDLMRQTATQCKAIGERYGVTVREDSVGGGSDGNFTAAMGIPTLDGLGPQGDGLHAIHEHLVISSLAQRATLVAGLLKDWEG